MKEKRNYNLDCLLHDIKAPIDTIKGLAKLIENKNNDEKTIEHSKAIYKTCSILQELLDDLVIIYANHIELKHMKEKVFSLPDLVENVCSIVSFQAKKKKQRFKYDINIKSEEFFLGQPKLITKILLNFINNSIKYTPEKGEINFSSYANELNQDVSELVFIIEDNGIGIGEKFLQNVFLPYKRENDSIVSKQSGNGLGLSICKKIVDYLHGDIKINSTKGKGSTFTIKFYIKNYTVKNKSKIKSMAILCDISEQNNIKNAYRKNKISLCFNNNLFSFLEILKYEYFQIILIDLSLAKDNKVEIIKEIKKYASDSLIILLKENDDETIYKISNVNAVIKKPFYKSALEKVIKQDKNKVIFINKSILIVEDNYLNLELINSNLIDHFPFVDKASNGVECLKKVSKRKYDIILLDINMPHLNGIKAYKKMISLNLIDNKTLVILLSSTKLSRYHHNLGLKYSLDKSFNIIDLKNIIDDFQKSINQELLLETHQ